MVSRPTRPWPSIASATMALAPSASGTSRVRKAPSTPTGVVMPSTSTVPSAVREAPPTTTPATSTRALLVRKPSSGSRIRIFGPPVSTITVMVVLAVRPAASAAMAVKMLRVSVSSARSATLHEPPSTTAGTPLTVTATSRPSAVPVTVIFCSVRVAPSTGEVMATDGPTERSISKVAVAVATRSRASVAEASKV